MSALRSRRTDRIKAVLRGEDTIAFRAAAIEVAIAGIEHPVAQRVRSAIELARATQDRELAECHLAEAAESVTALSAAIRTTKSNEKRRRARREFWGNAWLALAHEEDSTLGADALRTRARQLLKANQPELWKVKADEISEWAARQYLENWQAWASEAAERREV